QLAVAVAVAAVAGLDEPVETPGRVHRVGRLLDQLLHRDRAVRAGGVVVEVARDVRAGRAVGDRAVDLGLRSGGARGGPVAVADSQADVHDARCVAGDGRIRRVAVGQHARAGGLPGVAKRLRPGVAVVRHGRQGDAAVDVGLGRVGADAVDGRADVERAVD